MRGGEGHEGARHSSRLPSLPSPGSTWLAPHSPALEPSVTQDVDGHTATGGTQGLTCLQGEATSKALGPWRLVGLVVWPGARPNSSPVSCYKIKGR